MQTPQQLKRGLTSRHIRFMAFGSAIGTGLFYGSSESIKLAGPAVLLAYLISGMAVFMVMRALGEMAVHSPGAGSFSRYAHEHLGPLAGFLTGWTYVLEMVAVCLADVTAFGIYMGFWFPATPRWIWVLGVTLFIGALNLLKVRVFGEIEFWLSALKVLAIICMIAVGSALIFLTPDIQVSNLWQTGGFAPHGLSGVVHSLSVVVFAFGGIEILGLTAGEMKKVEKNLPHAINLIPLRILIFYLLALAVIMIIYPWYRIGDNGSPFVLLFQAIGIPASAHIFNLVIIVASISAINSNIFGAGRMMYGMAENGLAHEKLRHLSKNNVPWITTAVMIFALLCAVVLNYLAPSRIFLLMASVATFATVWVWIMILLAQLSMRRKMSSTAPLRFPMPLWPLSSIVTISFMGMVIVVLGILPETRISLYAGCVWLLGLTAIYMLRKQ